MTGTPSFREGLFAGVVAGALGALPACFRDTAGFGAWLPLAAATSVWLGPLLGGLPALRSRGVLGLLAGLGLATLPLALLLAWLKVTTHHRPLGAVVFALLATVVVGSALVVVWRALDWALAEGRSERVARAVPWTIGAAAALGPVVLTAGLLGTRAGRVALFDVALVVGLSALLLRAPRPAALERLVRATSFPLWLLVASGGVLAAHAGGAGAAAEASPALFAPLGWLMP